MIGTPAVNVSEPVRVGRRDKAGPPCVPTRRGSHYVTDGIPRGRTRPIRRPVRDWLCFGGAALWVEWGDPYK